jgi:predicted Zn-dependent protease
MTRQATRGQIANYATLPLVLWGGWTGYAVRQGAGLGIPLGFLSFDRRFESEADMLGIQYMYKAGYDPTATVDLFERMVSLQKRKPGTIARVFNTHPMTEDRLVQTQKNIAEMLPSRPEYVVTTSEFNEVRDRVKSQYVRREKEDPNRPRLRKSPAAGAPAEESDEKPTLKRRDWVD